MCSLILHFLLLFLFFYYFILKKNFRNSPHHRLNNDNTLLLNDQHNLRRMAKFGIRGRMGEMGKRGGCALLFIITPGCILSFFIMNVFFKKNNIFFVFPFISQLDSIRFLLLYLDFICLKFVFFSVFFFKGILIIVVGVGKKKKKFLAVPGVS